MSLWETVRNAASLFWFSSGDDTYNIHSSDDGHINPEETRDSISTLFDSETHGPPTPSSGNTSLRRTSLPQQQHSRTWSQLSAKAAGGRLKTGTSSSQGLLFPGPTRASGSDQVASSVDPLSLDLMRRSTSTEPQSAQLQQQQQQLQLQQRQDSGPYNCAQGDASTNSIQHPSNVSMRKKTNKFIHRLLRKGNEDDSDDAYSSADDARDEGDDTQVFVDQGERTILSPASTPRYIRVRSHGKSTKEFNRLFLAQKLGAVPESVPRSASQSLLNLANPSQQQPSTSKAIWDMKFNSTGKYLATAGQDGVLMIWKVISTVQERNANLLSSSNPYSTAHANSGDSPSKQHHPFDASVFLNEPIKELKGHQGELLEISWSKNDFIISSSMDKTVRLWHVNRDQCLGIFPHQDLITSISFHPLDDRFFLSGLANAQLCLWSIPEHEIVYNARCSDIITAVAFSPHGNSIVAGSLYGFLYFFQTDKLKPTGQLNIYGSKPKNGAASKITGIVIKSMIGMDGGKPANKMLITSNDSRIRLFDAVTRKEEFKYKGLSNSSGHIRASFGAHCRHIICGSEDGQIYIWNCFPSSHRELRRKKPAYEKFRGHNAVVTTACFVKDNVKDHLLNSGDSILALCAVGSGVDFRTSKNPELFRLSQLRNEEASKSRQSLKLTPSKVGPHTISSTQDLTLVPSAASNASSARTSPFFTSYIIVSADARGSIKVFRQDCEQHIKQAILGNSSLDLSRSHRGSTISRVFSGAHRTPSSSRRVSLSRSNNYNNNNNSNNNNSSIPPSLRGDANSTVNSPSASLLSAQRNNSLTATPNSSFTNGNSGLLDFPPLGTPQFRRGGGSQTSTPASIKTTPQNGSANRNGQLIITSNSSNTNTYNYNTPVSSTGRLSTKSTTLVLPPVRSASVDNNKNGSSSSSSAAAVVDTSDGKLKCASCGEDKFNCSINKTGDATLYCANCLRPIKPA